MLLVSICCWLGCSTSGPEDEKPVDGSNDGNEKLKTEFFSCCSRGELREERDEEEPIPSRDERRFKEANESMVCWLTGELVVSSVATKPPERLPS